MESLPLWVQFGAIAVLLLLSGFFSISETSMMALNRHRLKHLVKQKTLGASKTQTLLKQTGQLLSVILIGNSLINTLIPVLTTSIALRTFGNNSVVLSITTGLIAFLIIVFSEITPKIVGAAYPEKIALPASLVISPLMRAAHPVVWFVHLLAAGILRLLRIRTHTADEQRLSVDELRTIVLESGSFMPYKHRSILLNLLNLDNISVDDMMVPRTRIEALDLDGPFEHILQQLDTCHHNKLPVYRGEIDCILGILHVRKALAARHSGELTRHMLPTLLAESYFVPSGTLVFQQLQYFQENQERMGLIVNEYGEVQGLITPEDIIEELIGEFTSTMSHRADARASWDDDGQCILSGSMPLRELNRCLNLQLPVTGPKTLNGLILETLHEIPEGDVCVEISHCRMEIMHFDTQGIKTVKLFRPPALPCS